MVFNIFCRESFMLLDAAIQLLHTLPTSGRMGWLEQSDWASAAVLLADEAAIIKDMVDVPSGSRLIGLDRYGFDVVRGGDRESRQFAGTTE
jgi:hypothetical protein